MIKEIAILSPIYVSGFWALIFLTAPNAKNRARHFLGIFMLVSFLLYLGHGIFFSGHLHAYLFYDPLYTATSLLVYPMYYQYIRLLTADKKWNRRYFRQYLPGMVMGLLTLFFLLYNRTVIAESPELLYGENRSENELFDHPLLINKIVFMLGRLIFASQVLIFIFWGITLIKRHQQRILHFYSNVENRRIMWVQVLNISMVATALCSMVFNAIGKESFRHNPHLLLIPSVLFSSMLFIIGYLGHRQNQVVAEIEEDQHREPVFNGDEKWQTKDLKEKLENLFIHRKVHLNPELKIWDISNELATNRTYISNFINKTYGMNFSLFVNQYRIEEAKKILRSEEGGKFSLDSIGERCGFGSLNNFIRVFRESEKITPGRYRDQFH